MKKCLRLPMNWQRAKIKYAGNEGLIPYGDKGSTFKAGYLGTANIKSTINPYKQALLV